MKILLNQYYKNIKIQRDKKAIQQKVVINEMYDCSGRVFGNGLYGHARGMFELL